MVTFTITTNSPDALAAALDALRGKPEVHVAVSPQVIPGDDAGNVISLASRAAGAS